MANFAELLNKSGKTQAWVCNLTGASRQVVNNWYTGRTKKIPDEHRDLLSANGLWPTLDTPDQGMPPDEAIISALVIMFEVCAAARKPPETLNPRGLGRLLVSIAKQVAKGDGDAARLAAIAEAHDWIGAMATTPK